MSKKIEPSKVRRRWYRHRTDGRRGYLVHEIDDVTKRYVRLDRNKQDIDEPYTSATERHWLEDGDHRPLTYLQVAQVCHAADAALGLCQAQYIRARTKWTDITRKPNLKKAWLEGPPKDDKAREDLYLAISSALRKYVDGD